ncbi:MAG: hypothetical protein ACYTXA_04905 [Nostoc sp.]
MFTKAETLIFFLGAIHELPLRVVLRKSHSKVVGASCYLLVVGARCRHYSRFPNGRGLDSCIATI